MQRLRQYQFTHFYWTLLLEQAWSLSSEWRKTQTYLAIPKCVPLTGQALIFPHVSRLVSQANPWDQGDNLVPVSGAPDDWSQVQRLSRFLYPYHYAQCSESIPWDKKVLSRVLPALLWKPNTSSNYLLAICTSMPPWNLVSHKSLPLCRR
jgi:hypothetical protein